MVQNEVICRTYRIKVNSECGTAFTLESNGKQYIVTAKHLFKNIGYPSEYNIEIYKNGLYHSLHSNIYYHQDVNVDAVAILTDPYIEISAKYDNENTTQGLIFGQDVFFLGFPYNFDLIVSNLPNENTPVPFIKKACLSGFNKSGDLFLDGINNPGFSGGPVCFIEPGKRTFKIAGIINGYQYSKSVLYDARNIETDFSVHENTGIVYACNIKRIFEILEATPNK